MKYFLGLNKTSSKNIQENITHIPQIEKENIKFSNIQNIKNFTTFLYSQYKNKNTVVIRNDGFIGNRLQTPGLRYFYREKNIYFSWEYIHFINKYIASKYVLKEAFRITHFSFYTIFFIKLIYKYIDLYSNEGRELIHINNGIFGIYDSYTLRIHNCDHSLYFSYSLGRFLLYRVIDSKDYIYGKLFNNISINEGYICYDSKRIKIPSTFRNIKGKLFGIKKNIQPESTHGQDKIQVVTKHKVPVLSKYGKMCNVFNNTSIFLIDIESCGEEYTKERFIETYNYILNGFPLFSLLKTRYRIYPDTFDENAYHFLLLLIKKDTLQIGIQLNQNIIEYLPFIINRIHQFQKGESQSEDKEIILSSSYEICIHVVSEVLFLTNMLTRYWKIMNDLVYTESIEKAIYYPNPYIQIEYTFTKEEVNKLSESSVYPYYTYITILLIRSIASAMKNHFVFLQEGSSFDIIPIESDMSIDSIENLIQISKKANYSKRLLKSYFSDIFIGNFKELPVIYINIIRTQSHSVQKVYGNVYKNSVPMIINIIYTNNNELSVNITCHRRYQGVVEVFRGVVYLAATTSSSGTKSAQSCSILRSLR